eukprot:3256556-Pyramimonas_sp.AAC.1
MTVRPHHSYPQLQRPSVAIKPLKCGQAAGPVRPLLLPSRATRTRASSVAPQQRGQLSRSIWFRGCPRSSGCTSKDGRGHQVRPPG